MGRAAYEGMAGALPTATDHPFSGIMNAGRKVVFSRSLRQCHIVRGHPRLLLHRGRSGLRPVLERPVADHSSATPAERGAASPHRFGLRPVGEDRLTTPSGPRSAGRDQANRCTTEPPSLIGAHKRLSCESLGMPHAERSAGGSLIRAGARCIFVADMVGLLFQHDIAEILDRQCRSGASGSRSDGAEVESRYSMRTGALGYTDRITTPSRSSARGFR
jgi:hypothetical protein